VGMVDTIFVNVLARDLARDQRRARQVELLWFSSWLILVDDRFGHTCCILSDSSPMQKLGVPHDDSSRPGTNVFFVPECVSSHFRFI